MNEQESGFDAVHTASNPYCDDLSCWCHNDAGYHTIVIQPLEATDEEVAVALSYLLLVEEVPA